MSEWTYIGLAYAITWASLIAYTVRLAVRRAAAKRALAGGVK